MNTMERKIGSKGSVTIPSNMRRDLGIEGREKVNLEVQESGDILIRRIQGTCVFCGSGEDIEAYKGRFVCSTCKTELGGGSGGE